MSLITFDLRVGALFYHLLQKFLVVFVEDNGVEVSECLLVLLLYVGLATRKLQCLLQVGNLAAFPNIYALKTTITTRFNDVATEVADSVVVVIVVSAAASLPG